MESEDGTENPLVAAETLRHMEYVVMTLEHVNEQMSEFRGFKASLARIEAALKALRSDSHLGICRSQDVTQGRSQDITQGRSQDVARHRRPSDSSSGILPARLDRDNRDMGFQGVQSVSTGALHGMLTTLEEARAQELCRGRRKRTLGTEPEKSEKSLSPCLSGAECPAESPRPHIEVTGLHQPSSHDSPDVPKNPQQSSDFSCISVDQPPHLEKPPALAPRVLTLGDSPPILGRRKSLDNLRADCDAIIAAPTQASPFSRRNSTGMAALPTMGWFLLSLVGILDFRQGRKWRRLAWASLGSQMLGIGGLLAVLGAWHGTIQETAPFVTTVLYFLGALVGMMSLRRNKITSLLGPEEYLLDDYAAECDFLGDWWKLSSARLLQIGGFFALMLGCRVGAMFLTSQPVYGKMEEVNAFDVTKLVVFAGMALCYCSACYCVFHITAGLELAVDSFAVNCFSTGDMEAALMSWNVVQATLRQVSCKLSDFLMLLASSCVATMIMFAYQVVSLTLSEERESVMDVLMWMGWVYSPALLFLYVLSSAAAVTEKVDRLVPLVNSWSFDDRAVLDESRQYVVQYILHSRAGFYARGIRITASNVQKLSYYFAAGSFGFLANLWT